MSSSNSFSTKQDNLGRATLHGEPIQMLDGYKTKIEENNYDSTQEVHKVLSDTGFNSKFMTNDIDFLMKNDKMKDIGYTGIQDKRSKRKTFPTHTVPVRVTRKCNS